MSLGNQGDIIEIPHEKPTSAGLMYVEIVLTEMAPLHQSDFSLSLASIEMEVGEMDD